MSRFLVYSIMAAIVLLMLACIFTNTTDNSGNNTIVGQTTGVTLAIQPQSTTFNQLGQQITYNFVVTNTTSSAMVGPVTVTDDKMAVTCPPLTDIGDKDDSLDPTPSEGITCTAIYTITASDIASGSVTNVARAKVGALESGQVSAVIQLSENKVLTISVIAEPTAYSAVNQQIKYSYTIRNTGATPVGPTQFIVRDDRFTSPINCETNTKVIATNEIVTCSTFYTTTTADTGVPQIVSNVSASGGGAGTIETVKVTVTNTAFNGGGSGAYKKGDTIRHKVADGEWMIQIARCYGITFESLQTANPQVSDPDIIFPYPKTTELTVPNIGSFSTIFGPPCVKTYTVKAGDTWDSIANDPSNNASVAVLMEANRGVSLTSGRVIKIPLNSKNYGTSPSVPVTPPASKPPIQLDFPPGSPNVKLSGNIATPETVRYVFNGTTGQVLTVTLSAPTNDVKLAIYGPNNATLKALDLFNSFTGTLTANGTYEIALESSVGAPTKQYSLEITLTTPTAPGPIERVVDIFPGPGDSNVSHLRSFKGYLYFQANAGDNAGAELWRYDTGLKALNRVRDLFGGATGSEPAFLTEFADMLYFRANGNDGGGNELWRFNGNDVGRVADINKDIADANPRYMTVYKGALYFRAIGSDGLGAELWKYDGVTNPSLVKDINPGPGDSNPAHLAVYKEILYFSAVSNDGKGVELWKYDGTNATLAFDINNGIGSSNPQFLVEFKDFLYFSANANDNTGTELWRFDGTTATRAADINAGTAESIPTYLTVFKDHLYFSANGDATGFELWRFDGTAASRVADINPAGNSNPAYLAVHNTGNISELYFQANANDGAGAELWKFKGP